MTFKKKLTNSRLFRNAGVQPRQSANAQKLLMAVPVALLTAFSAQLLAQPKIILQTTPAPTQIPLQAASNVTIDPLTGDITATPDDPEACTATGSGNCDAQVDVISFSVNPSTVSQGQTFTATFSQRGAWECERTGLPGTTWNNSWTTPGSGQLSVIVGSAVDPDSYTLTLTCRNGTSGGSAQDSISRPLTVTESGGGGTPQSCIDSGRVPPTSWQQELNADILNPTKITTTWSALLGGPNATVFPDGRNLDIRIRPNRYGAFFFNTGTNGTFGQIEISDPAGTVTLPRGPVMISMSPCPGDFKPQSGSAASCRLPRIGGTAIAAFGWTRVASQAVARCLLPAGEDYYLNVVFVTPASWNESDPSQMDWQCNSNEPSTTCSTRLTPSYVP